MLYHLTKRNRDEIYKDILIDKWWPKNYPCKRCNGTGKKPVESEGCFYCGEKKCNCDQQELIERHIVDTEQPTSLKGEEWIEELKFEKTGKDYTCDVLKKINEIIKKVNSLSQEHSQVWG